MQTPVRAVQDVTMENSTSPRIEDLAGPSSAARQNCRLLRGTSTEPMEFSERSVVDHNFIRDAKDASGRIRIGVSVPVFP
jgi:hypothetical protein